MELTHIPHPLLSETAQHVDPSSLKSGALSQLLTDMRQAMQEHNGIGLAANQVGRPEALFIIDEKLATEYDVPSVFANPVITDYAKDTDVLEEGCLSIPGKWIDVTRARKIMFKALDGEGNKVKFRARGMLARVLQHETDHLNGMTIQDRAAESDHK